MAVRFFGLFWVQNLSQLSIHTVIFSFIQLSYSFFVFYCSRRGVSRCKHCSTAAEDHRSQPVSPSLLFLLLFFLLRSLCLHLEWFNGFNKLPIKKKVPCGTFTDVDIEAQSGWKVLEHCCELVVRKEKKIEQLKFFIAFKILKR